MMTLLDKQGRPKIVPECTYPLTGVGCIERVYTDLGTFEITPDGVVARDLAGTTYDELESLLTPVRLLRP
jgi:3-oxoadipate CoA-transferase beta subunit